MWEWSSTRKSDHFCVARRSEPQAPLHEPPWCLFLRKIAVQLLITEWSPVRFKAVIRESAKRYFCPLHSFTTEMFFWQRGPLLRFLAWIWFESCSFNTQASQALAKPLTLKPSHWSHCFTDLSPVYPTRLLSIKTALPIKNQWTKTATIRLWTLESFEINGIAKAGKVFKF